MEKLKPCPFCGGKVKLIPLDDEFNIKDEEYAKNPWSGLQYGLYHCAEENEDCPIATVEGEILGAYGYDTKREAAKEWNRRWMMCKWLKDEVCVNGDCPAVADFCPVVNHPGVCRYEETDEKEGNDG